MNKSDNKNVIETTEEELTKLEWKRQYYDYRDEPSMGIFFRLGLIGGLITGGIVIWMLVWSS